MQNYAMEFKKFSARNFRPTFPITAIRMHEVLCQDLFFDLTAKVTEVSSFNFSSAFFYDYYKIREGTNFYLIYVLDGVKMLHEKANTKYPLVRDRALYAFIYGGGVNNQAFISALETNPWLNYLCDRPIVIMSERVAYINSVISRFLQNSIQSPIIDYLDSGFTPRGVWGLDYMFLWKNAATEPSTHVHNGINLIPLDEYIASFN